MVRFGIIGFGKMGKIRKSLIDQREDSEVTMVCDPIKPCLDVAYTPEAYDIISHPEIDAVCICTPNYLLKDLVVASLNADKHVLCEKPPGISLSQVHEMQAALKEKPRLKLKFGFNHRYHEAILEAKRKIDSAKYGEILWIRSRYGKSVDQNFRSDWRSQKRLAGGGILMDQGIHMLDLLLHFCGPFNEVKSFCSNQYCGTDIEDNVFAIFRNKKGQTASLHSTMTQWRHLFSLEIFLEKGYMVVNGILTATNSYTDSYGKEELTISMNRTPAPLAKHSHEERFIYDVDHSWKKESEEFLNSIKAQTPIEMGTIDDAEVLMRLVEEIYANGHQHHSHMSASTSANGALSTLHTTGQGL